jgi:hypothetical protein
MRVVASSECIALLIFRNQFASPHWLERWESLQGPHRRPGRSQGIRGQGRERNEPRPGRPSPEEMNRASNDNRLVPPGKGRGKVGSFQGQSIVDVILGKAPARLFLLPLHLPCPERRQSNPDISVSAGREYDVRVFSRTGAPFRCRCRLDRAELAGGSSLLSERPLAGRRRLDRA